MVLRQMEIVQFSTGADVLSEPGHWARMIVGEDPRAWKMCSAGDASAAVLRSGSTRSRTRRCCAILRGAWAGSLSTWPTTRRAGGTWC